MIPKNNSEKFLIYIALGTNLGNRPANLRAAIGLLPPLIDMIAESPVYQTAPWGYKDQPEFLNQVIAAKTSLDPIEVLAHLKEIETRLGRQPTFRYGPRVVDLDLLFYADKILEKPGLQIPHPRLQDRAFVLVPLNDLNPDLRHPVLKSTVRELLLEVEISGITRYSP